MKVVTGAAGRMGRELIRAVHAQEQCVLAGAIEQEGFEEEFLGASRNGETGNPHVVALTDGGSRVNRRRCHLLALIVFHDELNAAGGSRDQLYRNNGSKQEALARV